MRLYLRFSVRLCDGAFSTVKIGRITTFALHWPFLQYIAERNKYHTSTFFKLQSFLNYRL